MPISHGTVTALLVEMKQGRKDALTRLMPLVYGELRRMARRYLRNERIGHTLQPTALVHEAYLRLVGQNHTDWQGHGQFFAVAAQMMRRILVTYAERRAAGKRCGNLVTLDDEDLAQLGGSLHLDGVLAVDEALGRLGQLDHRQAQIVEMRYYAGLSVEETAAALGVSPRTVKREWTMAQAWMRAELSDRRSQ